MSDVASPPITTSSVRVSTGIAGLDTILGGGFMLGGIYVIQGAPGAGKTILTNQICFHHVSGGGRALFVTLLAENHARMASNLRSLSFFDDDMIPDQLSYLSAFRELHEKGLKGLVDLIRREIQRTRASMLVIDGLVSAQVAAADEQTFKQFVRDLQEIALATDCTMFLTASALESVSPEQTMVDGLVHLNDRLYGWEAESDLQVTKFRGSGFLRGRHSYAITSDGLTVHPRIEALLAHPSQPEQGAAGRVSSGIAGLDAMIGDGGLPEASTTMVMGPSGVGKTTIGLQFLSGSTVSEPGLMFSFYETPTRLRNKAAGICPALSPLIESGVVEVMWQTPTAGMIDAYGEALLAAIRRRKVKRLFIDGLTSFKNAAIDPLRVGHFFSALANELRVLGVTTLYSLEVSDILGPAIRVPVDDVSSLAENMILLRYVELRSQLYRMISVLKIRDSDFDPSLYEFTIGSSGVAINPTSESAETILASLAGAEVPSNRPPIGATTDRPTEGGA
jgi:circadian clock protein KaiC